MHDALFDLADTWCPSISEDEYIEFFEILYNKIDFIFCKEVYI